MRILTKSYSSIVATDRHPTSPARTHPATPLRVAPPGSPVESAAIHYGTDVAVLPRWAMDTLDVAPQALSKPAVPVVTGVSGSGKSTVSCRMGRREAGFRGARRQSRTSSACGRAEQDENHKRNLHPPQALHQGRHRQHHRRDESAMERPDTPVLVVAAVGIEFPSWDSDSHCC